MEKITFTSADGTEVVYFPQSYTDAAVAQAVAAVAAKPTEIDLTAGESIVIKAN